ncbi:hypothetical protein ABK040_007019 [Willaertia magna]
MIYWIRFLGYYIYGLLFSNYYEKHQKDWKEEHVCEFTILPYDLDLNLHLNNAQYLSFLELTRFDMFIKHGNIFKKTNELNYGWVIAGTSFQFRRSVQLFEKLRIHTRFISADERFMYFTHDCYVKKKFIGRGIARICAIDRNNSKGGVITMDRFFKEVFGIEDRMNNEKLEERFKMTKESFGKKQFLSNNDSTLLLDKDVGKMMMSECNEYDSNNEEYLNRVNSFVFHHETMKESAVN